MHLNGAIEQLPDGYKVFPCFTILKDTNTTEIAEIARMLGRKVQSPDCTRRA